MAEILDLIAKVSWQTNQAELDKLNKAIDKQDDMLTELIRKGQRLEQQRAKTDNPAKVKELNKQMEANKKAIDSLTKATENQGKATLDLVNKQKQLAKAIAESTDPKQASKLLAEFRKLEQQIKTTEKSAGGLTSSFGNIGQSILSGLGLGVGSMGLEQLVGSIKGFVTSANQEFIDAEKTSLRLQNTLKNLGQEQYFDSLINEADALAQQIGYLDNDDIVSAQQKMLAYGKLSRNEISQLLPVIIDLAAKMETDVPSATQTMINILEGRGGQTLRDFGLTIKEANNTTERLGIVFGELGPKLEGSSEAVRNSAEGMGKVLDQQLADLQESVGASTINISNHFKETMIGFLSFVDRLGKTAQEQRQDLADKYKNDVTKDLKSLSDTEFKFEQSRMLGMIQLMRESQDKQRALQKERADLNPLTSASQMRDLSKRIKDEQQQELFLRAQVEAIIQESKDREGRIKEDALMKDKRRLMEAEEAEKDSAKKTTSHTIQKVDKQKQLEDDLAKQLEADRIKLDEFLLSADEKEQMALMRKYDEQMKMAGNNYQLQMKARENFLDGLLHLQREHEFEMERLGSVSLEGTKKDEKEKVDLTKNTAYQAMATRVADAQDEIKKREEKKQRDAEERQDLFDATMMAAQQAQSLIAIEQEKNDRLIGLQQERINAARENSASSLKIEEDRLNELIEKRQKYERAQRTIDAAVIVANQAVAISQAIKAITTSSTLGPAGIAANVIAIIAGLAASIAAVRGATADIPAFREGGYTGDGNPDNVSTTLGARPYVYHKKEFVMDEELTSKHRDLFEGLHKRDMVVKKLDDGQFYITRNGLDTTKLVDDHISIKNQMQTESIVYQLNSINEKLSQREVSITNNLDANGFGNVIATQLGRIEINKKLR